MPGQVPAKSKCEWLPFFPAVARFPSSHSVHHASSCFHARFQQVRREAPQCPVTINCYNLNCAFSSFNLPVDQTYLYRLQPCSSSSSPHQPLGLDQYRPPNYRFFQTRIDQKRNDHLLRREALSQWTWPSQSPRARLLSRRRPPPQQSHSWTCLSRHSTRSSDM